MHCQVRLLQRFDPIRCCNRYDFHSTAMRSFNPDKSIFEDYTMTWIYGDSLRGGQKHFGIRLAVRNVLGSDNRREPIFEAKHGQDRVDVQPVSRRTDRATDSVLL